ncbi:MAG TPA: ankyrin repeat domain-containing protein [Planctomycetota bacterium]|nr:ankyrin repeat domain-containing protein [Planctomycetota bacterium]
MSPAARRALLALLVAGCGAEPETPLARAAAADDVIAVRALLSAHPEAPPSNELQVALHWAARRGAPHAARELLDAGANIDGPDGRPDFGWTPLISAVHTQQWAFARQLLAWGARPDVPAVNGLTPLIMATGEPEDEARIAFVEDLLLAGADPHARTEQGATALGNAVAGGNARLATRLLAAAPDLRVGGGFTGTAVRVLATLRGDSALLEQADADETSQGTEAWPDLLIALRDAPPERALDMLARGADPHAAAPNGRTALMVACARGELRLVRALLAAGADPRAEEADHRSALSHAVAGGEVEVLRAVLGAAPGLKLQRILEDEGALFAARLAHRDALLALLAERGALP